ncbi:hypothetical protein Gasu2_34010 [Galdieria sulphuraria]|nr:hypothetical protein Gasu2_34010 [Galdieria sulphuraria]
MGEFDDLLDEVKSIVVRCEGKDIRVRAVHKRLKVQSDCFQVLCKLKVAGFEVVPAPSNRSRDAIVKNARLKTMDEVELDENQELE